MSLAPPKLLSYYSNKINIYKNDCYIPLPSWNSCQPPPQIYITPQIVYPPAGPYIPSVIVPIQQPVSYPGVYCGNAPSGSCGPCGNNPSCGPCGR